MVNCNPETVSTDYDTSDRLYFEPLTLEHVLAIVERERPEGVIVQLGGQTPLKLAQGLARRGVPIWGTSPDSIDLAEDRKRFGALLAEEDIRQPDNGTATTLDEALEVARRLGFPVLVRPSYVLGGRAMAICHDEESIVRYMAQAAEVSEGHPVLLDRFLEDATEFDLDLVADGAEGGHAVVCGILQHIEEAGIHSGDSAAVLPPHTATRRRGRGDARHRPAPGQAPGRARPDEHPVRAPPRRALRARGQPARLAHGAVHRQGGRPAAGGLSPAG